MIVLGLGGALGHDPAAALVVDGRVVAAAEEERFNRQKHAKHQAPELAARYCLQQAGLKPSDVQVVAYPYAPISLWGPARWHYARRHLYTPERALVAVFNGNRRYHRNVRQVLALLERLGIDERQVEFVPVEHHLAHVSSAYHLSGYRDAAIMSIDGFGEYCSTWLGYGEGGVLHCVKRFYAPDSLGGFYGAVAEFLGFEMLDGEYKVMGMAPYGDPSRLDVSPLIDWNNRGFQINTRLINCVGWRRYKRDGGRGTFFAQRLVDLWGSPRGGDELDDPYVHIAAAVQATLEKIVVGLARHHLGRHLERTGRLCYAGGVALNVKCNQALLSLLGPDGEMFVQPAAADAGTALGAATFAARQRGERIHPLTDMYLGPAYSNEEIAAALGRRGLRYQRPASIAEAASELLAEGEVVGWFQGRMEFGPRALGNRSILGNPARPGIANLINAQIKHRERWRPFCPSLLDRASHEILQSSHPSPYMTLSFPVSEPWRSRIPEVVHVDGTTRPQVVTPRANPRFYELIARFATKTRVPVLLNTSMNRRDEPLVCSPDDALSLFCETDLRHLAIGDFLVQKTT